MWLLHRSRPRLSFSLFGLLLFTMLVCLVAAGAVVGRKAVDDGWGQSRDETLQMYVRGDGSHEEVGHLSNIYK